MSKVDRPRYKGLVADDWKDTEKAQEDERELSTESQLSCDQGRP